jgi:preprotein translocase subunit SecG
MEILITVLTLIVCLLLIIVVLIQNPKGGLAANFTSTNQVMGVRKTADFLEKATWTLGSALLALSILSAVVTGSGKVEEQKGSELDEKIENVVIPTQGAPVVAPDAQPSGEEENNNQ